MFAEVIPAAVSVDGSQYFNKNWRHAAGHVVSPPLRQDPLTGEYLLDLLSKSVAGRFCQRSSLSLAIGPFISTLCMEKNTHSFFFISPWKMFRFTQKFSGTFYDELSILHQN